MICWQPCKALLALASGQLYKLGNINNLIADISFLLTI